MSLFCVGLNIPTLKAQADVKEIAIPDSIQNFADSLKIKRLIDLGIKLTIENKTDGTRYFDKAVEIAQDNGLLIKAAKYINAKGLKLRYASRNNLAIRLYQRSIRIGEILKDTLLLSRTYNNIGVCYRRIDSYQKALEYHQKALQLAEAKNDSLGMAMAINSIGNVELMVGNLDKSLSYFNKSLKLEQNRKNMIGIAINFNNIGHVYQEKGFFLKALHYYQLSLNINRLLKSKKGIAICNNDIADIYIKMGRKKEALSYALNAIKLTKELNDCENLAYSYLKAGQLFTTLNQYSPALHYLDSSVRISRHIRARAVLEEAYTTLFKIHKALRNYKKAIHYLQLGHIYHDSLMSVEIQKNIARLQIKFELERNKNQIALLEQKTLIANEKAKAARLAATKQRYLTYIFLAALTLALLILAFGSFYLASRNKRARILEKNNKEIEQARQALEQSSKELSIAKDKAEESDRTKSRFMASISHEIRTPLNSVIGYSDLLFSMASDPKQKNYLKAIQASGKSLLNLMNDILDLSKIETGKFSIQNTEMDIRELAEDVKSIFSLKASSKGLEINISISDETPQILIFDEIRLRQILINLTGNAIKFTQEGNVSIIIKSGPDKEEGTVTLSIQVRDTGSGIPIEDQERIFEPFEQGREHHQEGSGLGLSISKRLVEALDGIMTLESKPENGTVFTLQFTGVKIGHYKKTNPIELISDKENQNKTVLFISQEHPAKKDILKLFEKAGFFLLETGINLNNIRKKLSQSRLIIFCCLEADILSNTMNALENDLVETDHFYLFLNKEPYRLRTFPQQMEIRLMDPPQESLEQISAFIIQYMQNEKEHQLFERRNSLDPITNKAVLDKIFQHTFIPAKNTRLFDKLQQLAVELKTFAISNQMDVLLEFSEQMETHVSNFDIDAIDNQLIIFEKAYLNLLS